MIDSHEYGIRLGNCLFAHIIIEAGTATGEGYMGFGIHTHTLLEAIGRHKSVVGGTGRLTGTHHTTRTEQGGTVMGTNLPPGWHTCGVGNWQVMGQWHSMEQWGFSLGLPEHQRRYILNTTTRGSTA